MAFPRGGFAAGAAGISSPGGAYSYAATPAWAPGAGGYPQFYAGTFFIDTGYDDPVLWTTGVQAAEVYAARVYAASGVASPAPAAGTYTGKWRIAATPVWEAKFWATPHSNTTTQKRVLIQCDVYLSEPLSLSDGAFQRVDSVAWSLYRI